MKSINSYISEAFYKNVGSELTQDELKLANLGFNMLPRKAHGKNVWICKPKVGGAIVSRDGYLESTDPDDVNKISNPIFVATYAPYQYCVLCIYNDNVWYWWSNLGTGLLDLRYPEWIGGEYVKALEDEDFWDDNWEHKLDDIVMDSPTVGDFYKFKITDKLNIFINKLGKINFSNI